MKKKIEAIREYLKYYPNDHGAKEKLQICEYAEEIGVEPRGISYGYAVINSQIKAGKEYHIANSTTNYVPNGEETIIIWHESCGRLAFVGESYWFQVQEEWDFFMGVLKSYKPLDWDEVNNTFIYDVENGKKLIADYETIITNLKEQLETKVKAVQVERKKAELKRLQKELEAMEEK